MNDVTNLAELTFAAELLGQVVEAAIPKAMRLLIRLSNHASPLVREGAVYGMAPHWRGHADVASRLKVMAADDPSPGVRAASAEVFE